MAILFERCNTGAATGTTSIYDTEWVGQTFTPSVNHKISSIKVKMFRGGTPGTLTASIKAVDGSGHPTGSDLCVGTTNGNTLPVGQSNAEWREILLGSGSSLNDGTKYAIVLRALTGSSGNAIATIIVTGEYANGDYVYSSNSGATWAIASDDDNLFEEYGGGIPRIFYF